MEVHNKLGPMHREKVYQNAVEELFKSRNIKYLREQRIPLYIDRKKIGNYFIDFIVEEKMCLELKAHFYIMRNFDMQILSYMKSLRLRLGIVVNFRSERLWSKRLVLPDKYLC
ncbi:GxxExxY protein [Patescibacteria group bacterium]|nr:GxxExxY protein [Patescibacteria group bacterium]